MPPIRPFDVMDDINEPPGMGSRRVVAGAYQRRGPHKPASKKKPASRPRPPVNTQTEQLQQLNEKRVRDVQRTRLFLLQNPLSQHSRQRPAAQHPVARPGSGGWTDAATA